VVSGCDGVECGAEHEVNFFHTSLEINNIRCVVVSEKNSKKENNIRCVKKSCKGYFCNITNAVDLGHFYLLCVLLN
jgi:hypothetical protein